jgi:hypothetical protein
MIEKITQKIKAAILPSLGGVGGGFLLACSGGLMTHEAVREAAESYYSMLIKGNYKGFVNGYADAESLPADFRSQLVDATAQFMAKDDMRSLMNVSAISDSLAEDSTAVVMLQLQFSDSTSEQIEVPLILQEDGWKMWTP